MWAGTFCDIISKKHLIELKLVRVSKNQIIYQQVWNLGTKIW